MRFPLVLQFVLIAGCFTTMCSVEPVDGALPCPYWNGVAPIIDGSLDDALWRGALVVPLSASLSTLQPDGQCLLTWDDAQLYCAFICPDNQVYSSGRRRDLPLLGWDRAELFIAPGPEPFYYDIKVAPNGQLFDQLVIAPDGAQSDYRACFPTVDLNLSTATRVDAGGFTIEMAMPFSELKCAPRRPPLPGDEWRFLAIAQDDFGGDRDVVRGSQPLGEIDAFRREVEVASFHPLSTLGRKLRFIDSADVAWRKASTEPGPHTSTWRLGDMRGVALSTPRGTLPYNKAQLLGSYDGSGPCAQFVKVEAESLLRLCPHSVHYPLSLTLKIPGPQTVRLRCRLPKNGALRVLEGLAEGSAVTVVADGQTIHPRRRLYGADWRFIDIPIPAKGAKRIVTVSGDTVEMTVEGDGRPPDPINESEP